MRTRHEDRRPFLRAGCFKPLTFPYRSDKFYETREQGLAWLKAAGEAVGLPVVTEVMHIDKIDLVAEHTKTCCKSAPATCRTIRC